MPKWKRACFVTLGAPFLKSIPQGAATSVYCAVSADALAHAGGYFLDSAAHATVHPRAADAELAAALWATSERVCGFAQ